MIAKFLQRKFLVMVFGQIVGVGLMVAVTMRPEEEEQFRTTADAIINVGTTLIGALIQIATAVGWIRTEGQVDIAKIEGGARTAAAAMDKVSPAVAKEVVESAPPINNTPKE